MTLQLDETDLPGLDHRVTAQGQIERKDLSGQSSSGASSHGGWKAWILQVSVKVPMRSEIDLILLTELFHAREGGLDGEFAPAGTGKPKLYEINEPTANALGILKVRFSDFFRVSPRERERLWEVNFTLIEEEGIPARKQERTNPGTEQTPAAPTGAETTIGTVPSAGEPEGFLVGLLKTADELAGKYIFGIDEAK